MPSPCTKGLMRHELVLSPIKMDSIIDEDVTKFACCFTIKNFERPSINASAYHPRLSQICDFGVSLVITW